MNNLAPQYSPVKVWLLAARPKTWPAAIAPVVMGSGMVLGDGGFNFLTAVIALIGALAIQIATNLTNDYFDFKKGADTSERKGPLRMTQAGLIKPKEMQSAIVIMFGVAALTAVWLFLRAGWPIAVIGVCSILSGLLYTAGPRPLGYLGLGEIFVLIFFGPVAVAGTYYVQSLEINMGAVLAGFGPGFLSAAILVVNNLRDIDTDKKVGKRTLAVRFGKKFAQAEYFVFIVLGALTPILVYAIIRDHVLTLAIPLIILLCALPSIRRVFTQEGEALNAVLAYTGLILLVYSILYATGWIS